MLFDAPLFIHPKEWISPPRVSRGLRCSSSASNISNPFVPIRTTTMQPPQTYCLQQMTLLERRRGKLMGFLFVIYLCMQGKLSICSILSFDDLRKLRLYSQYIYCYACKTAAYVNSFWWLLAAFSAFSQTIQFRNYKGGAQVEDTDQTPDSPFSHVSQHSFHSHR